MKKAFGGKYLEHFAKIAKIEPHWRGSTVKFPTAPFSLEAVIELNDLQI